MSESESDFKTQMLAYLYGRHGTLELERLALMRKTESVNQEIEVVRELYRDADGGTLKLWTETVDYQRRYELLLEASERALTLARLLSETETIGNVDLAAANELIADALENAIGKVEGKRWPTRTAADIATSLSSVMLVTARLIASTR